MALWAGIDEAGYGPPLGPLVVAGTAFETAGSPAEGDLWEELRDAVARHLRGRDGRLVVNDSKQVYSPARGLKLLEEGVLAFLHCGGDPVPGHADGLCRLLGGNRDSEAVPAPWFADLPRLELPLASNLSALRSKAAALKGAMDARGVRFVTARAAVVLPAEFNRIVERTRNKSLLLFQKCGLVLLELWGQAGPGHSRVLVDKHGGRLRYRRLLLDVFPGGTCDVLGEEPQRSVYLIRDPARTDRSLTVIFQEEGDALALPAALASMTAKYVRELYMAAFNAYWQRRVEGLRPTAGYHRDARRFLDEISPLLREDGGETAAMVRRR